MKKFFPIFAKSVKKEVVSIDSAAPTIHELKILTWNVWFADISFSQRMQHILDITLNVLPDIACYQEVLPEFAAMIRSHPIISEHYQVSPFNSSSYGVITIVKAIHKPKFETFEFSSKMGRELLRATCSINGSEFVIGNVHLESLNSQSIRVKQLRVCNDKLSMFASSVLVGDFNFCSEKNFHDIAGIPLENDALASCVPSFVDTWPLLARQGEISVIPGNGLSRPHLIGINETAESVPEQKMSTPTKQSSSVNGKPPIDRLGFTFDSDVNPMITKYERMRYDRVLTKLANGQRATHISLVGTDPIDPDVMLSVGHGAPVRGLWASDHFGVVCTISLFPHDINSSSNSSSGSSNVMSSQSKMAPTTEAVSAASDTRESGGSLKRPQCVISVDDLSPALNHTTTTVTNRDGSRYQESRDPVSGAVASVSLDSVNQTCRVCNKSLGFTIQSKDVCDICARSSDATTMTPDFISYEEIEDRVAKIISECVSRPNLPIRLLAIDFDATLCQIHTYGRWTGSAKALAAHVRPVFRAILKIATNTPNLRVGIVTFSGQRSVIKSVLQEIVGYNSAETIFIRAATSEWTVPSDHKCNEGKQPHIASILQDMFFDTGEELAPQQVILIDDDKRNIKVAKTFSHRTVVFPDMPLPGIHMRGHMEAGGVTVLHRCQLKHGALLCISQGSVVDFVGFEQGAIVNAANSGGLGGGGVDGAISNAGGRALLEARRTLPLLEGSDYKRIAVGSCRSTGPGKFGRLQVPFVLHAVGPAYQDVLEDGLDAGIDEESALHEGDALLRSAYESAMECASDRAIEHIGFSLLSSGIFRGPRSLREVLTIAVETVASCSYEGLREAHLIAFTEDECDTLLDIVTGRGGEVPLPIKIGAGGGADIRTFLNEFEDSALSI